MTDQFTLTTNDIKYIEFYLKEEDTVSGSITCYDLTTQNSIWFRMRKYGSSTNAVSGAMSTIASPHATLGYCRILSTIPSVGTYSSEVEVYESTEQLTWDGPIYIIKGELG